MIQMSTRRWRILPTTTSKPSSPPECPNPKTKPLVENQVWLIYNRIYAKLRNQTFFDLESLNHAIKEKNREHTQTRMQISKILCISKVLTDFETRVTITYGYIVLGVPNINTCNKRINNR
jgi:hypothetical protein